MTIEYTWTGPTLKDDKLQKEVIRTLYTVILKITNELAKQGVIDNNSKEFVTSPATVCALQMLDNFNVCNSGDTAGTMEKVGTLGMYTVYRNYTLVENDIFIKAFGHNGKIVIKNL